MDERSIEILEFPAIQWMLAEEAASAFGREAALALQPFSTLEEAMASLEETSEARDLLMKEAPPFRGIFDVRKSLDRAKREGSSLEPQELLELASTMASASRLKGFVQRFAPSHPRLEEKALRLIPLEDLVGAITSSIVEGGYVVDGASEPLRLVRQEITRLRGIIQDRLQAVLSAPAFQPAIVEPIITLRHDRYVIPVKPNFRAFLRGIVQDQSQSGATLFIEPEAVVELNNRLRKAQLEEEEEVRKVLVALTEKVRLKASAIEGTLRALTELDLLFAKARLAKRWKASRPKLSSDGELILLQARHPLLIERQKRGLGVGGWELEPKPYPLNPAVMEVVPIDVRCGGAFRALLITGPNTGGKTVALKTVGLLSAMALSGLHIPASPDSQIPFFAGIYADIGDEQSIEQSLSTFSSHMSRIVKIVERAGKGSLVLLDELGAGTDPAEGAALGIAILEGLLAQGALVVATTHLDAVKVYAASHPEMENACVEFDLDSLRPLYKLSSGFAGRSHAVEIAQRLGLPSPLVERARELLGKEGGGVASLLERLRQHEVALRAERVSLERERREAARLHVERAEALRRLKIEAAAWRERARLELQGLVVSARKEAERLLQELRRKERSREVIREVRERLEALQAPPPFPTWMEEAILPEVPGLLQPGQRVFVKDLAQEGFIVEGPGPQGMVEVQLPLGRVRVRREALVPLLDPQVSKWESQPRPAFSPSFVSLRGDLSPELNLIGMTVEEAVRAAERYLDDAFLAGLRRVRIIHGKGTGRLRQAVEEMLRAHPLVEAFHMASFDEGGAGATVVELSSRH
ncbi:MAG: endonuclease MutS2 [Candidatus Methylomirabilales bacterium]